MTPLLPDLPADHPLADAVAGLTRKHVGFAFVVALGMLPVGLFLVGIGLLALELGGGAGHDTGMVVLVTAYAVTDFWGGGVLAAVARLRAPQATVAWTLARVGLLAPLVLVFHGLVLVAPVQLALAAPAAFFGARLAHKQSALRRAGARAA